MKTQRIINTFKWVGAVVALMSMIQCSDSGHDFKVSKETVIPSTLVDQSTQCLSAGDTISITPDQTVVSSHDNIPAVTMFKKWYVETPAGRFPVISADGTQDTLVLPSTVDASMTGHKYILEVSYSDGTPAKDIGTYVLDVIPVLSVTSHNIQTQVVTHDNSQFAFTITATGPSVINYKFVHNSSVVANSNSNTYFMDTVTAAETGSYTVEVTASGCEGQPEQKIVLGPADISVNTPNPNGNMVCPPVEIQEGGLAFFTTTITEGMSNIRAFHWLKDASQTPVKTSATDKTLEINPVAASDAGLYSLIVEALDGTKTTIGECELKMACPSHLIAQNGTCECSHPMFVEIINPNGSKSCGCPSDKPNLIKDPSNPSDLGFCMANCPAGQILTGYDHPQGAGHCVGQDVVLPVLPICGRGVVAKKKVFTYLLNANRAEITIIDQSNNIVQQITDLNAIINMAKSQGFVLDGTVLNPGEKYTMITKANAWTKQVSGYYEAPFGLGAGADCNGNKACENETFKYAPTAKVDFVVNQDGSVQILNPQSLLNTDNQHNAVIPVFMSQGYTDSCKVAYASPLVVHVGKIMDRSEDELKKNKLHGYVPMKFEKDLNWNFDLLGNNAKEELSKGASEEQLQALADMNFSDRVMVPLRRMDKETRENYQFLVKPNKNLEVLSIDELFGENTAGERKYTDGFDALSSLDINKDGFITEAELDDLYLWNDINGDGNYAGNANLGEGDKDDSAEELTSLKDININEDADDSITLIDLNANADFNMIHDDHSAKLKSIVRRGDGSLSIIFYLFYDIQDSRDKLLKK